MKQRNKISLILIFSANFSFAQSSNIQKYFKENIMNLSIYETTFAFKDFIKVLEKDSLLYNKWSNQEIKYLKPTEKVDEYYNQFVYKIFWDTLSKYPNEITIKIKKKLFANYQPINITKDQTEYLLNYVTDETFVQASILFTVLIFRKEEYFDLIANNQKFIDKYTRWLKNPHPLGITSDSPVEIRDKWKNQLKDIFRNSKYKLAQESVNKIKW